MTLTRARTIQYVGILFSLMLIAVGYWYWSARAGVKMNTSALQPQGTGNLDSGLAGYWAFDNGSGTTATDASTNGNNGTLTSGPTWTTGQIGSAVSLDGTDDYISTGTTLASADSITLSAWVKGDTPVTDLPIFGHINGQAGSDHQCLFYDNAGTENLYFGNGVGGAVGVQVSGTGATLGTNWHHVVYTNNGTKNSLYLDGVRLVETTSNALTSASEQNLEIGRCQTGGGTFYFDGLIDEARVYRRALSVDEIGQLYRLTAPTGVDTSLKGYWSFNANDISGTTAYDRSGAGNNGTLTNGPATTPGISGQALSFDGTNDYVATSTLAGFSGGNQITFSAWIQPTVVDSTQNIVLDGNGDRRLRVEIWTDNKIRIAVGDGVYDAGWAANFVSGNQAVTANNWYYVVGQWDGSNIKLFVNGIQEGSDRAWAGNTATMAGVTIGRYSGGGTNYFPGKIDEVRIYNRALTAAEIKSLYDSAKPDATNSSSSQAQGTGRLDSGLAGYWSLDNGSGTTATDASTNGNNGALTNGPTWSAGQIGSAVTFDGTNDDIRITDSAVFDVGGTGSWCLRFYPTANVSGTALFMHDAASGRSFTSYKWIGAYLTSASAQLATYVRIGGVAYTTTETAHGTGYYNNAWHHVCSTFNRKLPSNRLKLYIDGVLVSQADAADGDIDAGGYPVLGAWEENTAYFTGSLDDVRIYNRDLSADEVTQLYRLNSPTGTDTSLKGYWSFNGKDLSGTTAYDRSGAGNNGTLTGGPTSVNGIIGQGLSLDGTNDVVQITSDAPNITGALTASFWLKTTATSQKTILGFWQTTGWTVQLDGDGSAPGKLSFYSNNSGFKYANTAVNDGAWHYVAFTLTSGGVLTMYRDGVVDGTYSSVPLPGSYTDDKFFSSVPGGGGYFPGTLDEIRIYDRVLTAAEIQGQYEAVKPDKLNSSVTQPQGTGRLDSGLVGYWPLDETTGSSAADTSTNGYTGTLQSMENGDWTSGRIGNGLAFDGTNEYVSTGVYAPFQFANQTFTVSGWFNKNNATNPAYVIAQGGCTGGWLVRLDGGTLAAAVRGSGSCGSVPVIRNSSSTGLNDGSWHHFAAVITTSTTANSAHNISIYIDGALNQGSLTLDGSSVYLPVTSPLTIASRDGGLDQPFHGTLDEMRIYNRGLSADEVSQLYRLGTPTGTDTSLKGYWSFNGKDLSGTNAYDRSGAGNNGTLTNGPTVINGKLGQGLSFDGSNDYVNITSMSSAMFSNTTFTVTGWFKTSTASGQGVLSQDHCDGGWFIRADSGTLSVSLRANGSCGGGGAGRSSSATNLANGMWHHFATVITTDTVTAGNNNIVIYIDGALNQGSLTAGLAYGTAGDSKVQIGTRYSGDQPFLGLMDEIRIYNRGLTAAEVLSLYNQSR